MKTQLLYLVLGLLLATTSLKGQIKIGDNPQTLDPASVLELESNSRVLVITRMTTIQMENTSPLRGAVVYNTDTQCVHFYDGALWINLCDRPDEQTFTTDAIVNFSPTMIITPDANGTNFNFEVGEIRGENIVDTSINGSVDIQEGSITGLQLQDATVSFDKLADGTATGELLQWNGAEWVLIDETGLTVTEIDGIVGNEILNAADGTLVRTGAGSDVDPFVLDVSLGGIDTDELADDAVTSAKIDDGAIANIDVSATAAIDGTKINPDFGAQNIATTGTLSTTGTASVGANTITNVDGTTGQVLTTDGAGNATWQNTGSVAVQTTAAIDGDGLAATPLDLADDAVTSAKIDDGAIANIDVSPTAAIDGTKIDPAFGAQNITTTGTLASGNATITGTLSTTGTATVGANAITNIDGATGQVLTTDGAGNATWQNTGSTAVQTTAAIDGDGLAATPLDLADDAVTSAKIDDGAIANIDVSATAAIDGTKIDPAFGAQNITTTGTLASGNATITGTLSTTGTATVGANAITNIDGATGQVLTTDGAGNATWQNTGSTAVQTTAAIDGDGLAATPLDLADDAVTSAKIDDGAIANIDVSATAAIDGTKINPDFGAQNIATTGTLSTTGTASVGANTITNVDGTTGQVLTTDGAGNATWQNTGSVAVQTTAAIDGDGLAATPLDLADDAVTSAKIDDGAIANIDVSPTAAIDGTKIDPAFGAQNITTTGTLASGNATITGTLSTTGTATVGANAITNIDGATGQVLTTDGAGNATWQNTGSVAVQTTAAIDGDGLAATPLDLADDAVTSAKIDDGAIANIDVSATAAIDGTKIDPAFGAQNITTTGTLASGNATITGTLSTTGTATVGANAITNIDGATGQVLTTDGAGNATWQNTAVVAMGKVDAAAVAENANGATVTRNSPGNYTVALTTPIPSADYIVQLTLQNAGANASIEVTAQAANNFTVQISQTFIDNITTPGTPVLDSNPTDSEWFFAITDF